MNPSLKILPLGGLGEIGMNMLLVQYGKHAILIDCGVMFPDQNTPGMDLIIPSLKPLLDSSVSLEGIVLTHGHEDHIGALPFVLRRVEAPVYGTRFTLEVVRRKLDEFNLSKSTKLNELKDGQVFKVGPFTVETIRMSHSIADAVALAIRTPEGIIIHTGDFKLDDKPADGRKTDLDRFYELGKEGVLLLMSDSTNVEMGGCGHSESSIKCGLQDIATKTPGWFLLSSFASHIPRLQQALEIAQENYRRVLPLGRTMIGNIEIARRLGYLKFPDQLFLNEEELLQLPRRKVMILCTGSQGEQRSALAKISQSSLRNVILEKGDNVVLSSRFIPGNEKAITAMINDLYRRGAEVITNKEADVHVSGHAYKEDLRKMLMAVKPKYFVPLHGEYRHLLKHTELAIEAGVIPENAFLLEDGHPLMIRSGSAKRLTPVELERSVVLHSEISNIGSSLVKDRKKLGYCGVISATLVVDVETGDLLHDVEIHSSGVHVDEQVPKIYKDLEALIEKQYFTSLKKNGNGETNVAEEISSVVRKYMKNKFDRKPVVLPAVIRL